MKQSAPMNSTTPCGRANAGPSRSLPCGSRCEAAIASATMMPPTTHNVAASGDAPAPSSAATQAAPAMPPMLNRPWNPDIIDRPLARSTMIAWMFMVTSIAPRLAPNTSSAAASSAGLETVANRGRTRHSGTVDAMTTRRHPNRAASAPANDIVTSDPTPRQSRSSPSAPSPIPARALANGTSGAQAAMPKPAMKNTMRVERCSRRPGAGRT